MLSLLQHLLAKLQNYTERRGGPHIHFFCQIHISQSEEAMSLEHFTCVQPVINKEPEENFDFHMS
jgi:hypothetical protein